MNIAITGAYGLVGSNLIKLLESKGDRVTKIPRLNAPGKEVGWQFGNIDSSYDLDAVVHLAGENIATGKWTDKKKKKIYDSRVVGTRTLCEAILKLEKPPKVMVCASAVGFYGDRGDEVLNETSAGGNNFLSQVCKDWENAANEISKSGIRVVCLRFGMILSADGGALAKMLTPFKMGMGGRVGNGNQYMSWISIDDVARAVYHAITTETLNGPVNAVAPEQATNIEFTKTLGSVLSRPTILPLPAFAAKLVFGEMADELLLSSTRVEPANLLKSGFKFQYPTLREALNHILK